MGKDNILDLLPKNMSKSNIASEQMYAGRIEAGQKANSLSVLLRKADDILYFCDQILPNLSLQGKILEIGSGIGWLSSLLKLNFPETYIVTTDVSHSALQIGNQVMQLLGSKVDLSICTKIEQLPFEDNFFDYVVGAAVLHQTEPPEVATKEIFRVLKNDGTYIGIRELAIPRLMGAIWGSSLGVVGRIQKNAGIKYGNYNLSKWKSYFENAGFSDVDLTIDKNPNYKHYRWDINLYYRFLAVLPEDFVRRFFASSLDIRAKKCVH